jgi:hypothetical protein
MKSKFNLHIIVARGLWSETNIIMLNYEWLQPLVDGLYAYLLENSFYTFNIPFTRVLCCATYDSQSILPITMVLF